MSGEAVVIRADQNKEAVNMEQSSGIRNQRLMDTLGGSTDHLSWKMDFPSSNWVPGQNEDFDTDGNLKNDTIDCRSKYLNGIVGSCKIG